MDVIIPEISDDNSISLSFGLKFKLMQIFNNGYKSEVKLIKSSEEDIFYGLFDVEDVDFEIFLDNRSNDYKTELTLTILKNRTMVYIESGKHYRIRALESYGKHLHFITQSTEEGKLLVSMSAHTNQTTIEEESINCSRIGIDVMVLKTDSKPVLIGPQITLFIRNLRGKTYSLMIGLNNTIDDLKYFIREKEGISMRYQKLIFCGIHLENGRQLFEYDIKNESTVCLIMWLTGGDPLIGNTLLDQPNVTQIGERGVICFGRQSDQRFVPYSRGPIESENFLIKPFSIELRMKPKYSI